MIEGQGIAINFLMPLDKTRHALYMAMHFINTSNQIPSLAINTNLNNVVLNKGNELLTI